MQGTTRFLTGIGLTLACLSTLLSCSSDPNAAPVAPRARENGGTRETSTTPTTDSTGAATGGTSGSGQLGAPRDSLRVFFSGHSAFGLIMPTMVDQIARALGRDHAYNLQMGLGSSMRLRLSGKGNEQARDGRRMSFQVTSEIPSATTIEGGKYEALVVTESVPLMPALIFGESIASLRAFYDLLTSSNPKGTVYFFDTWDGVANNDFAQWIRDTRAEIAIWECIASAVNRDPKLAGNPIQMVPGGIAFARAVEEALAGKIPGVTVQSLFAPDLHHPSSLGAYYIALVMYSSLYHREPAGAPTAFTSPQGPQRDFVSAEGAAALQALAWRVVTEHSKSAPHAARSMAECRSAVTPYCTSSPCTSGVAERFAD